MLFQIAEILPREAQGVVACCTPVPILLRQQLTQVHQLVIDAREATPTTLSVSDDNIVHMCHTLLLYMMSL